MVSTKQGDSERVGTDQSLAVERRKTDEHISKRRAELDESADREIATARLRADAVLARARALADDQLQRARADSDEWERVEDGRRVADEVLEAERSSADENLARERHARGLGRGLLAFEREDTDRKLLVERGCSETAIQSRDDFLAMASHDLRNMIAAIAMAAAPLTIAECADDEHTAKVRTSADRIGRYTRRLTRLVDDLVDVVSIEAGLLSVAPKLYDAAASVRDALEVFQPVATAKGVAITSETIGSPVARYDPERGLQVLSNLLGNALKFTPKGGRIHVRVEPVDNAIRFSVSDTGPGIPPEQLKVIFDRFWRASDKHGRPGLGLGLFIARCIVEAHGGTIWAESRLGEGSTFYFTLPAASPDELHS